MSLFWLTRYMELQPDLVCFNSMSLFMTVLFMTAYVSYLYDYFRSTIDELLGINMLVAAA